MARPIVHLFALGCAVTTAITAHAQQPAPPPSSSQPYAGGRLGAIFGTVEDSLHDGVALNEATVAVMQLPTKSALTTQTGAFRIDSLPPGKYTLELLHPFLDTLGVRIVSDTIVVTGGALQTKLLSLPSAQTLSQMLCSPVKRRLGPAVIVGQVLNTDSNTPAVGAEVSAAWVETSADVATGVRTVPNLRKATVQADGSYRLCGLPAGFNGSVQAVQGKSKTAEVRVDIADQPLALRVLHLAPPGVASDSVTVFDSVTMRVSTLRTGPATITGRVTSRGGLPVPNAFITVQGGASQGKTGNDGNFTLTGVPVGTQAIFVRRVGYTPVELPVDVTTQGPNTVAVRLDEFRPQLARVEVKAAPPSELKRVGFERRMKRGTGRFMTEADIEKAGSTMTSDLLRRINGLHIVGSGRDLTILSSRGEGCVRYMIDRNSVSPDEGLSLDEILSPREIVGIEFYQTADVPMELVSRKNSGCALLVIWSREQLKDPKK